MFCLPSFFKVFFFFNVNSVRIVRWPFRPTYLSTFDFSVLFLEWIETHFSPHSCLLNVSRHTLSISLFLFWKSGVYPETGSIMNFLIHSYSADTEGKHTHGVELYCWIVTYLQLQRPGNRSDLILFQSHQTNLISFFD